MNTIEIPEKNLFLELPQSLGECSSEQYKEVAYYLYQMNTKAIDFHQFKVLCLYKLLGLKYTKKSKLSQGEKDEKDSNILMLSELIEDFFEKDEKGNIQTIKLDFLHNPLYKIRYKWRTYYGPTDFLQNITFGEYMEGLGYFMKFINPQTAENQELERLQKAKDELFNADLAYPEWENEVIEIDKEIEEIKRTIYLENQRKTRYLRELFCVFYRKKRWFAKDREDPQYDIRVKFDKHKVFQQSEKMIQLDPGILYGFFLFFFSFQSYLDQAQINIEGQDIDLSILFEKNLQETQERIPGIGMLSIAFDVSSTQVFGDLEKVKNTNFWEVILHLYNAKKRYLEEESKTNTPTP